MTKLPEAIKVCGLVYRVQLMDKSRSEDAGAVGQLDRNRLQIFIADFLPEQKKAETLLHEVLHAATDAVGLMDEPAESDEGTVNPLSRMLFAILRENPELVFYITNTI